MSYTVMIDQSYYFFFHFILYTLLYARDIIHARPTYLLVGPKHH